ncbi:hypothetical protein BGX27_002129 [Mortierella sp. AM989]|nr:hypothetical protein BGX27_002129 [Mortierella sp. AM989]
MCSISPFSIPCIVDSICDYLPNDDVVNCKKVCKDWVDLFAQNEWRSLFLTDPTPATLSIIRKHAYRLESLSIYLSEHGMLEMKYWDDGLDRMNCPTNEFRDLLELTRQNPRLRLLMVSTERNSRELYDTFLIPSLRELMYLTELTLRVAPDVTIDDGGDYTTYYDYTIYTSFDLALLAMILADCPSTLESLHITLDCSGYDSEVDSHSPPRTDLSTLDLSWKPLAIRKFHLFSVTDTYFQDLIHIALFPFLKNCSLMKDLSLPSFPDDTCQALMKTIGGWLLGLRYLSLNNDNVDGRPFGFEVHHFGHIVQPIKFLQIDLKYLHDSTVLEVLRRNGSDELEALRFTNTVDYFPLYAPPTEWFPNLTKVDYYASHRGSGWRTWTRSPENTSADNITREEYNKKVELFG